jgi:hypothetical protein
VFGAVALALLLAGCGGTRVSDQAIQQAAGIGQISVAAAPVAAAAAGGPETPTVPVPATGTIAATTATGTTTTTTTTAAAPTTTGTTAAAPVAGAVATKTSTGAKGAATTSAAAVAKPAAAAAPAAPAAAKALGPATKSPVRVGVVGTFSGPVGALVKDTVTGIRVWGQDLNTRGGLNGHPVEILVGDDGGDPARFISLQQEFVEQKGVIAFLYATLGFAPNFFFNYMECK